MLRPLLLCCTVLAAAPLIAAGQQLRGAVADASGAAIGGASIRLLDAESEEVGRATADTTGAFQLAIPGTGDYLLKVSQHGFRTRRVPIALAPGAAANAGKIQLEIAGCDGPGIICDWFGGVPEAPVSRGLLHAQAGCSLAFTKSEVFCAGDPQSPGGGESDIRVSQEANALYFVAMNGAALSAPGTTSADCSDAHPKETKIRIDGLSPGDDICLLTHDQHWSHVFPTADIHRGDRKISLWVVTRKR